MASARGAQIPGRTRSNHPDASARYPSDTGSWFDSSSYQDASSDQESLYLDELRSSTNRSDSESESSGILDRSSSIIDRFRQCEPSIPRFQQSTASARGRQREKSVEAAGRSESRGPSARQRRSESQEPGLRRGQDRNTARNGSPDRLGRSTSLRQSTASHRRSESQEPGLGMQSSWADNLRTSTDTRELNAGRRRSESQEPGLRSQAGKLRRSTDTRELNAGRRRSESQEPGFRSRAGKEEQTARGDWAGNLRRSFTDAHGPSRRSESQEPGYRSRTVSGGADWAEDLRRSTDTRNQSGRRRRSESQEPGYRSRAGSDRAGWDEDFRRSMVTREQSGRRRSESQEPGYRSQAAVDVLDERGRRQSTNFDYRDRYRRSESHEPGLRSQAGQDDGQDRRGRSTRRGVWTDSLRQSTEPCEQSSHHRRSESQEPRRRRSESREPVYGRSRSESQGPTSTRQYFAPSDVSGYEKKYFTDPFVCQAYPADAAEEKTIRAVHSELKEPTESHGASLYDDMRSEVRRAVSDLKTEIEWSLEKGLVTLVKTQGNADIEAARQPCSKPEESENRDPQLLSLADEEEARHDIAQLVKIVDAAPKASRTKSARQKKEYISKELNEEAQRFLDEFASISTSEPEDLLVESVSPARASTAVLQSVREETERSSPPTKTKQVKKPSPTKDASSPLSERKLKEEVIPRWKTGLFAVNTDGVVMPWLDWEPEIDSPLLSDAMFSSGISRSYPCSTIGDVNWEYLASIIPKAPDVDSIHSSDELILQRIRFDARIQAGRMHLCKQEF